MAEVKYREIEGFGASFCVVLFVSLVFMITGLYAAWYMDHNGHWVTGMDNQIVWGIPHVFAIFLIVSASGALNVASIASVFGKVLFKPLARFSALTALALLLGGLSVLVLDLGWPNRLLIALTHFNFSSVFAWNIFFYSGFLLIVSIYLWVMMDRKMEKYHLIVGLVAFLWRLALTTATGLIFGFLVAREAYDSAILAPLFIAMSFLLGLAVFFILMRTCLIISKRTLDVGIMQPFGQLLRIFIVAVLYFVAVMHLTSIYADEHQGIETFILLSNNFERLIFWGGQIFIGSAIPLFLLFSLRGGLLELRITMASILIIIGGVAQIYIIVIGGQSYPLVLFPGYQISSPFFDGIIANYSPSALEFLLGFGGIGFSVIIVLIGSKILPFLPMYLGNNVDDSSNQ